MSLSPLTSQHAAVIGASIAGSAAATALSRHGAAVTMYEPRRAMGDGGFGLCVPGSVLRQSMERRLLLRPLRSVQLTRRAWLTSTGPAREARLLWLQELPAPVHALHWDELWRGLYEAMPDAIAIEARAVSAVRATEGGVETRFDDGSTATHTVAVGADGIDSIVRRSALGGSTPSKAPYGSWRGVSAMDDVPALPLPLAEGQASTVGFPGGHLVAYPLPPLGSRAVPRRRGSINWVLYASDRVGGFDRACAALPAEWEALVRASGQAPERRSVGDLRLDAVAAGRILLVGDAATITRPHTGSGATKALEDAIALHDLLDEHTTWPETAAAFNALRAPAGNAVVELGRRLGHDQVEQTPAWAEMTEESMRAWAAQTIAGGSSYLYRDAAAAAVN